jgi:hypothetical protein
MNQYQTKTYTDRIENFQKQLNELNRIHGLLSLARLILFLIMAFAWSWLLIWSLPTGIITGILSTIGFFALIKYHQRIEQKRDHQKFLLQINQDELACCEGNYSIFNGANYRIDHHHPYSYDMDLFGEGSLFQYINRTCTHGGEEKLAHWLTNTPLPAEVITNHQQAVGELADKIDFRHHFRATGMQIMTNSDDTPLFKVGYNLNRYSKKKKSSQQP